MSGGTFGYSHYQVEEFAIKLRERMESFPIAEGEAQEVVIQKVRAALDEGLKHIEDAAKIMRAVDLYYSGDTGPESFLEDINEIGMGQTEASPGLTLKP